MIAMDAASTCRLLRTRWRNGGLAMRIHVSRRPGSTPNSSLSNALAYHVEDTIARPTYVLFPDSAALQELSLTQPAFEALASDARVSFEAARKIFM